MKITTHLIGDTTLAYHLYPTPGRRPLSAHRATVAALIAQMLGEGATIEHTPQGAPFVKGSKPCHISITHCDAGIAVALNTSCPVGIDMETLRPTQLRRISGRFLSDAELKAYSSPELLLKAWTSKEAIYKAALTPGTPLTSGISLPLAPHSNTATAGTHTFHLHHLPISPTINITLAVLAIND